MSYIDDMQKLYEQIRDEPARPRMAYFACRQCKAEGKPFAGMGPEPVLTCPEGHATVLAEEIGYDPNADST